MPTPYNTTTGAVGTISTTGAETKTIVSYDLTMNDSDTNFEDCTITIDADMSGNVSGEQSYLKRISALAQRTTGNVVFVGSSVVTLGPISSYDLNAASVSLILVGATIQLIATGVEGYDIVWRGELKLRIN